MKLVKGERRTGRAFLDILIYLLNDLSTLFSEVDFIIDGLDECVQREELLDLLPVLVKDNTRLLVASRPEIDIVKAWGDKPQLQMELEAVKDDITKHVQFQFEFDKRLKLTRSPLKDQMISQLVDKSSGM
jgi:hypothetical protein